MYGDPDKQASSIINQNSENGLNSAPKIAVYISGLELDRNRLGDATHVSKIHIRERAVENGVYTGDQGSNYTIERLMPTPFNLKLKADVWSSSTDQKLQILEQILMFFNPSLEIQTSDNYVDWTSLSVVDLVSVNFTSRSIPVGNQSQIDIATMELETPIWISPPVKVKKMGIITSIFTSIYDDIDQPEGSYIDGLGHTLGELDPYPSINKKIVTSSQSLGNYDILVAGKNVLAMSNAHDSSYVSWYHIVEQYPGNYIPGLAKLCLIQPDGTEVVGYGIINMLDETIMTISEWDPDTFPANTQVSGPSRAIASWGSFDAVIDPVKTRPTNVVAGTRYLLIDGIGGGVHDTFTVTDNVLTQLVVDTLFTKVNFYTFKVNGILVNSSPMMNPIYPDMATVTLSGNGVNAKFNIELILFSATYSATISNQGTDYNVGDKIKVRGNILGGAIVENDCVITVMAVDMNGAITNYKVTGASIPIKCTIIPDVPVSIGSVVSYELFVNEDGPDAWKNSDGSDFIANMNDIIEWDGSQWVRIFESNEITALAYQTNIHTLAQYKWANGEWIKSFEGLYKAGHWRLII